MGKRAELVYDLCYIMRYNDIRVIISIWLPADIPSTTTIQSELKPIIMALDTPKSLTSILISAPWYYDSRACLISFKIDGTGEVS